MNRFALACWLLATASLAAAVRFTPGQVELVTLPTTTNGDRYYFAYFPQSRNPTATVPVAMFLHDVGVSCFETMTDDATLQLKRSAESFGVLLVAPCGVTTSIVGPTWNTGSPCDGVHNSTEPVDDEQFLLSVMQSVSARATLNTSAVAIMGFGFGGMMAQNMVCVASQQFQFSGAVDGIVTLSPGNLEGLAQCTSNLESLATRPRSILISGDQDGEVGWSGEPLCAYPTPVENFMQWGARNGCLKLIENWNNGPFESRKYTGCTDNADVELIRWWGGDHSWPTLQANNFSATHYFFSNFFQG